jgi:hypothetical protein
MPAPVGIPTLSRSIMKIEVSTTGALYPSWDAPVDLYFRRFDREWPDRVGTNAGPPRDTGRTTVSPAGQRLRYEDASRIPLTSVVEDDAYQ